MNIQKQALVAQPLHHRCATNSVARCEDPLSIYFLAKTRLQHSLPSMHSLSYRFANKTVGDPLFFSTKYPLHKNQILTRRVEDHTVPKHQGQSSTPSDEHTQHAFGLISNPHNRNTKSTKPPTQGSFVRSDFFHSHTCVLKTFCPQTTGNLQHISR